MSHEEQFLDEIQETPHDPVARLVYADWLEERGDPRAEVIRVREQLKSLSPVDKSYWDLKDCFREMQQQHDPQWLAALEYDAVYRPSLATLSDDRHQRWRWVEEFIELWHEPLTRASGYTEEELDAVEYELNSSLPAALREWYALAGKWLDLLFLDLDIHFRSPQDIFEKDIDFEETFIVLDQRSEGSFRQYAPHWGLRQKEMDQEDPGFRNIWHEPFDDPANSLGCVSELVIVLLVQSVFRFGSDCLTIPWNSAEAGPLAQLQFVEPPDWSGPYWHGDVYEGVDLLLKQPSYPLPVRLAQRSDRGNASLPKDVQKYLAEM